LIFLVSVPVGVFGTVWAFLKLRDIGERRPARIDWVGNITFATALVLIMLGITTGIRPYGSDAMSWGSPAVVGEIGGGIFLLAMFVLIESRVAEPMVHLGLFRIRAYAAGNLASLLTAVARGGLQFVLVIWLQGIWLPEHGYDFATTPLWAGLHMLPSVAGLLVAGPISGILSDRFGARGFATLGALLAALSFFLLARLPVDFPYSVFALLLFLNGVSMGLFISPNLAAIMGSLPASRRGVGAGMTSTFQNSAQVLSIGIFFSLMIIGMTGSLPHSLYNGLVAHGVTPAAATRVAHLPPVTTLFATFLGYNPLAHLLGPHVLSALPRGQATILTSRQFFPRVMTTPFAGALGSAFTFAVIACVLAAAASWTRGVSHRRSQQELAAGSAAPGRDGSAATPALATAPSCAAANPRLGDRRSGDS
jgi:MFS family permease